MAWNVSALMKLSKKNNGRGMRTASFHTDGSPAGSSSLDNFMVVQWCGEA